MMVSEFREAKTNLKAGHHVIFVRDNKTRKTYGPADVVISKNLFSFMDTYLELCRPASESDKLFLNWGK